MPCMQCITLSALVRDGVGFHRNNAAQTDGLGTRMLDRTDDIAIAADNWLAQFESALAKPGGGC